MFRFQGQSDLNDCKPCDFRTAIEEAFLAENGFIEKLTEDINVVAGKPNYLECTRGIQEATGSNQDQEWDSQDQASRVRIFFFIDFVLSGNFKMCNMFVMRQGSGFVGCIWHFVFGYVSDQSVLAKSVCSPAPYSKWGSEEGHVLIGK